jgi:hypothetical protein
MTGHYIVKPSSDFRKKEYDSYGSEVKKFPHAFLECDFESKVNGDKLGGRVAVVDVDVLNVQGDGTQSLVKHKIKSRAALPPQPRGIERGGVVTPPPEGQPKTGSHPSSQVA